MGNKKAIMIWRLMLYENIQKTVVFKTYEFSTMQEIAYVLNQKATCSTVSKFLPWAYRPTREFTLR
jgi:hypothetical protein